MGYPNRFARLRDYSQDLDAILVARPSNFSAQMCQMWQDHVGRALLKPGGQASKEDPDAAVDEAEDQAIFIWLMFVCLSMFGSLMCLCVAKVFLF